MFDIEKTYKPKDLQALEEALEKASGEGKIIAGGTDVVVKLREGLLKPKALIDISTLKELQFIRQQDGKIRVGAGTTFSDLEDHPLLEGRLRGLKEGAMEVGSPQIRNAGTIGGNICNASPAADVVPPLLALDALVVLKSSKGQRTMRLEDFFLGKGQVDLGPGEYLYAIEFEPIKAGEGLGFSKLGPRKALAISKICTGVYLQLDKDHRVLEIRIANGSLGPTSLREREVEEVLRGKPLTKEHREAALNKFTEVLNRRLEGRWDRGFKKEAIRGVFTEALTKALDRARTKEES